MSAYLEVRDLCVSLRGGPPVLRSVSLDVEAGQVHGLVGRVRCRQVDDRQGGAGHPAPRDGGDGGPGALGRHRPPRPARGGERRRRIGAEAALIPQDPLTALNPSRRIGPQITGRLVDILGWPPARALARARDLLAEVRIAEPERVLRAYPHELSGGMRQRVLIAAAFASEPKLIVADEPTTALDVTVQREVLRLIAGMQARHGTAVLFVTHDLGVVSKVCGTLSVLYGGRVVEDGGDARLLRGPGASLFRSPPRRDAAPHRPGPQPPARPGGRDPRGGRREGRGAGAGPCGDVTASATSASTCPT